MHSTTALIALLSLAGSSLALPAPYDDGQYHPSGNDGAYTWAASTAVAHTTSVAAPPATTKVAAPTTTHAAAVTTSHAAAPTSSSVSTGASTGSTAGKSGRGPTLSGDGGNGWPTESQWVSFEDMWKANTGLINTQCTGPVQNSPAETQAIHDGILAVAKKYTQVPAQYILATIMQESHGCVRVGATSLGVTNPGIMQDHNGKNNCVGAAAGACSTSTIQGMIEDGVGGTLSQGASGGNGLSQLVDKAKTLGGKSVSQDVYIAARLYNSGDNSYKTGDNLSNPPDATAEYSQDIANRLVGYVF